MQGIANRLLRSWVTPAVLILVVGVLGTFRPVFCFHSQHHGHSGLHQPILPSEGTVSSADGRPRARSGMVANPYTAGVLLTVLVGVVATVLKARRTAFVPAAIRRLKLPRAAADSSPSS